MIGKFALLVMFFLAGLAHADLPVHCLHEQVRGTWNLFLGENNHRRDIKCDNSFEQAFFVPVAKLMVDLQDDSLAVDITGTNTNGFWSMIYDQGFEVIIGGRKYFSFSKYFWPVGVDYSGFEPEHTTSFCDQTMMGWYHDLDGANWGCWYGTQNKSLAAPLNELFFADSSPTASGNNAVPQQHPVAGGSDSRSFLSSTVGPVSPFGINSRSEIMADDRTMTNHMQQIRRQAQPTHQRHRVETLPWQQGDSPSFSFIFETGQKKYVPEATLVAGVNAMQASWRARSYPQFQGMTMHEMLNMMGGAHGRVHSLPMALPNINGDSAADALPAQWDWRDVNGVNYVGPVRNQGSCGSCYAFAAVGMLEARSNIALKLPQPSITLSPQSVVSCNPYSQGCRGGFPYLVGKFGEDFGIQLEQSFSYSGVDDMQNPKCRDSIDPTSTARVLRVKDYHYIGGFYGGCNEADMRMELYQNGPIVGTFDAQGDFQHYSSGIYHHIEETNGMTVNKWEKTTHSVLIVGWGEAQDGEKYWIIRNSYGPQWGEGGYIRFRRGTDECAMESMSVAATPIVSTL